MSARTEWQKRPDKEWVRALSVDLYVALGAHGLRSTEAALDAIVGIVIKHGATDSLAGASVPAVDPSRSTPNANTDASTPPVAGVSHV